MPDRQDDVGAGNAQLRLRHRLDMCDVHADSQDQTYKREREIIRPEIRSDAAIRRILAQTLPVLFMNPQFHTK